MRLPEPPGHIENPGLLTSEVTPQGLPHDVLHRLPSGIGKVLKGAVEVGVQAEPVHRCRG